ncbi:MAG: hypothetical protein ACI4KR_07875 [Ruminiclostridium sp.]
MIYFPGAGSIIGWIIIISRRIWAGNIIKDLEAFGIKSPAHIAILVK